MNFKGGVFHLLCDNKKHVSISTNNFMLEISKYSVLISLWDQQLKITKIKIISHGKEL